MVQHGEYGNPTGREITMPTRYGVIIHKESGVSFNFDLVIDGKISGNLSVGYAAFNDFCKKLGIKRRN